MPTTLRCQGRRQRPRRQQGQSLPRRRAAPPASPSLGLRGRQEFQCQRGELHPDCDNVEEVEARRSLAALCAAAAKAEASVVTLCCCLPASGDSSSSSDGFDPETDSLSAHECAQPCAKWRACAPSPRPPLIIRGSERLNHRPAPTIACAQASGQ
jgi:hypothetical protein